MTGIAVQDATAPARPPRAAAFDRRAGYGAFEVRRVADRSVVTRVVAKSPLRLLTPRGCAGNAAWVFSSTFGGGLVAGDQINIDASVGEKATCVFSTQASTKVYRSIDAGPTRQSLRLRVGPGGVCALLPDPLTCFAGAVFEQRIDVDLDSTATLVLVDWLTSGRRARGERWAFQKYLSRIDVRRENKLAFRDAVLLDEADGPIDGDYRMGRCDCFGVVLLLGPRVEAACAQLLNQANAQPVTRGESLIFSASPLAGGMILRVAGPRTEIVGKWIRDRLRFVPGLLGGDPWARKW
ncbi:MAG TPA: urease accessory protein UreD [Tepidisphaeraceae bacterium]|jgi:urease accessory protein|nr:urease accessory protein UreD [Tepidisphaeraceae bacterium]